MCIWYSIYYIYCTFTNHIYVEQLSKRYQWVFIKSEYLRNAGSTNQKTVPTTPNQDFRVLTSSMYTCQYNFPPWLQPSHGCKTRLFSGSNLLKKTEGGGHSPTLRNPYDLRRPQTQTQERTIRIARYDRRARTQLKRLMFWGDDKHECIYRAPENASTSGAICFPNISLQGCWMRLH